VEIFTDGSCIGNPGPGGWAFLMKIKDAKNDQIINQKILGGGEPNTTNNQMELMAVIQSLEYLDKSLQLCSYIEITTDSMYLKNGITVWINDWKRNGWKTAKKKPVKNQDLWVRLDIAKTGKQINWIWIKGHSGHKENEMVNSIATKEAKKMCK